MPFAKTIMVAVLAVVFGLSEFAFIVNVALPVVTVDGFIVNQLAVVCANQVVFEVTEIVTGIVLFFVKLAVFADTDKMVSPAACVTVINSGVERPKV